MFHAGMYRQDDDYEPIKAGSIDGTDIVPHDRAIARAETAKNEKKYDADRDPKIQGDPERTLFVGRLPFGVTEAALHQFFSRYGRLARLRVVRDIVTGLSRGYAFVEFEHERDAREAWHDRIEFEGKPALVEFERERMMRGWIPRRLGGGLGGKKESGQLRFGGRDRPFKKPILLGTGERGRGRGGHHGGFSSRGGFQHNRQDGHPGAYNAGYGAPYGANAGGYGGGGGGGGGYGGSGGGGGGGYGGSYGGGGGYSGASGYVANSGGYGDSSGYGQRHTPYPPHQR